MPPWKIWIDTGGTFTDCIALSPSGNIHRCKVLSSACLRGRITGRTAEGQWIIDQHWGTGQDIFEGYELRLPGTAIAQRRVKKTDLKNGLLQLDEDLPADLQLSALFEVSAGEEAPVLAARLVTGTPLSQPLPEMEMRLGTTKGTNALLEGKTAPVLLITTKGFADLPYIGTQQRPHLFQLDIPEPVKLHRQVIEVDERVAADGRPLKPLEKQALDSLIAQAKEASIPSVAIALLNAWKNPEHEQALGASLRKAGIAYTSLSHELMPAIKLYPRQMTTLVNAGLTPILDDYLRKIERAMSGSSHLHVMTSAGGLNQARQFHAKDSLLSGPAGGVVGAATVARTLGYEKVLTLDMGGTSTDTARFDGKYDYAYSTKVGGVELTLPCLSIETVAAGGGSVCWFDGHRLCVGPESAGASPGPACYGAGGPLTITDVNLLLGKLDPSAMGIPVSREAAVKALRKVATEIATRSGIEYSEQELLKGFEAIADEKMADAIRRISVAKGFDPREYALLVFGGAGGLHGCSIAAQLGIETVILPYDGGLLSAFGIGSAAVERFVHRQILQPLSECASSLAQWIDEASREAILALTVEGIAEAEAEVGEVLLYLRFKGQEQSLEIKWEGDAGSLAGVFERKYRELFNHFPEGHAIEVESIKVFARAVQAAEVLPAGPAPVAVPEKGLAKHWDQFTEGDTLSGPAILLNDNSTAWLPEGWELEVRTGRNLVLHHRKKDRKEAVGAAKAQGVDPINLELFTNRFAAIAQEMGVLLQRTAFSVNIKERLDFSCAVLSPDARLLVNAPHIPVHLGSLGICARLMLQKIQPGPGDVLITNHPKYGGSHLPDITLLMPVYEHDTGGRLLGYVINRAHHAELGGKRPGSMPPDARNLAEEGVVFPPMLFAEGGKVRWAEIEALLKSGPWPSRSPSENLADLNAAFASLRKGAAMLRELAARHGAETVNLYMTALQNTATEALQSALRPWRGNAFNAEEFLDDGHKIAVRVETGAEKVHIDFSGSSATHPFNLNANIAIVHSVVIYVLRLLCQREIPLNEGLMQGVEIILPEGSFLHPDFDDDAEKCPAVVGGNTEVSQRITDTLLKALAPLTKTACSQGTMNNLLFGNEHFGYYETIGGGAGAGNGFHGRSAVHQHMTNTRITDPEDLELRYPVRLLRFALRKNSGGNGKWKGGDGIVRELEFLEEVELTILSQHRKEQPYGLSGGSPGMAGKQYLIRKSGAEEKLAGVDSCRAEPGDRIVIETPGGGGFGQED
ncbi:MAG: 5-oxoprolinase [Saprospirales bacterium]|nr:5-oxoprolinase [Saprospirales bacterium]